MEFSKERMVNTTKENEGITNLKEKVYLDGRIKFIKVNL